MVIDNSNKKQISLAILSGILLTLSFPKTGLSLLAWFALVPLLYSLHLRPEKNCFRTGFVAGFVHFLSLTYWLVPTMQTYGHLPLYQSVPVLILLAAYLALYIGIFSVVLTKFRFQPLSFLIMVPALWVSLEYIRSFFLSGFPWELLGYSQYKYLHLIQIADITGVYGVSWIIIFTNVSIFQTLLYFSKKEWPGSKISKRLCYGSLLTASVLLCAVWMYGSLKIKQLDELIPRSESSQIAILQGNIPQSQKWDPKFIYETTKKYIDLSSRVIKNKPALIVWPETAAPFYFYHDTELTEIVKTGIIGTQTSHLVGSPSYKRKKYNYDFYNSAYLINPDGTLNGKYDKAHLVPFGEYVPLKKWLPFIGKMVEGVGDFKPGKIGHTIKWDKYQLGVQICYEIIFPDLARAMVKNNADLIVNITNDAWYGRSSAPYQHFSMAVFRAVENRRSLVRAANTGISGFIDPAGRITGKILLFQEAVMTRPMPILTIKSFYTRFGDIFASMCLVAVFFTLIQQFAKRRKKTKP